jgi:hypothetical protein
VVRSSYILDAWFLKVKMQNFCSHTYSIMCKLFILKVDINSMSNITSPFKVCHSVHTVFPCHLHQYSISKILTQFFHQGHHMFLIQSQFQSISWALLQQYHMDCSNIHPVLNLSALQHSASTGWQISPPNAGRLKV